MELKVLKREKKYKWFPVVKASEFQEIVGEMQQVGHKEYVDRDQE